MLLRIFAIHSAQGKVRFPRKRTLKTHCVPFLGKLIASVINMWLVYACSALAAILVIMIIKIAAFGKPDDNVTDGVKRKKSRK